jgi:general stress protein 26
VLATVNEKGIPRMRWLTPIVVRERPGAIFAVTTPGSAKTIDIESKPKVEWMLQTRGITEVVNLRGTIYAVDNPSLKSEIMEQLGSKLTVFWKANPEKEEFIVLETVIEEARYLKPMKGYRETVMFHEGAANES